MSQEPAPEALRAQIARDLRPVAPLAPPAIRLLAVVPAAIVLLFAAVAAFGLRADAPRLGVLLTWGASALQMLLGLGLTAAALREAVPGTTLSRRALGATFATACLAIAAVTWITWLVSPTTLAGYDVSYVWKVCFGGTLLMALPPLVVSGWLVSRAFPLRAAWAGALYGLGAGLMADAGWRLFCHFSAPGHVFSAHTAAVAAATVLGAVLAHLVSRNRDRLRRPW